MSGELSIQDALKRANVFLKWLPLAIFAGSIGIAYVLFQSFSGDMAVITAIVSVVIGVFLSTWLWGVQAVKWRLWAYPKVSDYRLLEQKAINRQLIWPRQHIFTRWEMVSRSRKDRLQQLYIVLDNKATTVEEVDDRKYPDRTEYKQGNTNFIAYAIGLVISLYLMIETPIAGIAALIFFVLAFLEWKKLRSKSKLLVIDDKGVEWQGVLYRWDQIKNYQVKALTMQQKLLELLLDVELEMHIPDALDDEDHETFMTRIDIDLEDLTENPFSLEATLDAYKYRYEKKRTIR